MPDYYFVKERVLRGQILCLSKIIAGSVKRGFDGTAMAIFSNLLPPVIAEWNLAGRASAVRLQTWVWGSTGEVGPMSTERRKQPRFQVSVPVEAHVLGDENGHNDVSSVPLRCVTSDLSVDGCYIESMDPVPVGTRLELKIFLEDTLLILARVVTCYPQVGYGIQFLRMLPEDQNALSQFLKSKAKEERAAN